MELEHILGLCAQEKLQEGWRYMEPSLLLHTQPLEQEPPGVAQPP